MKRFLLFGAFLMLIETACCPVYPKQEHRKLTRLLNVLLRGKMSFQSQRSAHFWGCSFRDGAIKTEWVQQYFCANLGPVVVDELSEPASEAVEVLKPEDYYDSVCNDMKGLRVPADLDDLICCYLQLPSKARVRFDRAAFWLDVASRQWEISMSASFASLVSAAESMIEQGASHRVFCEACGRDQQHDVPGATEQFRSFFETYAPGATAAIRRSKMYGLRSGILHGSQLMQLDQDIAFGWDPPGWDERELHEDLGGLTRIALRNWLRSFCVTA